MLLYAYPALVSRDSVSQFLCSYGSAFYCTSTYTCHDVCSNDDAHDICSSDDCCHVCAHCVRSSSSYPCQLSVGINRISPAPVSSKLTNYYQNVSLFIAVVNDLSGADLRLILAALFSIKLNQATGCAYQ